MDFFQGVVTEYLRASRSTFVNTEYLLQLDEGDVYIKDRHWYCDVVAVNHGLSTVQLCEISFSKSLQALVKRLSAWSTHWPEVVRALYRDSSLRGDWAISSRVFIPTSSIPLFEKKASCITHQPGQSLSMPPPLVTPLEEVLPWKYRSWNQKPFDERADA